VASLALEKAGFSFRNAFWQSSAQWLYLVVPSCHAIWWELHGQWSLEGICDAFDLFSPSLLPGVPAMS